MTLHIAVVGPIATENIAHLLKRCTADLPPGYGGAPLLGTLIDELLQRGHTVSAFTTSPGAPLSTNEWIVAGHERFRINYCGLRPHSFRPKNGRFGRATDFFSMERTCLKNAILAASPDVVHAHWSYEFGLAAIETGLPNVISCHDVPHKVLRLIPNLYRLVRYGMARRCLSQASIVTAVSPYVQSECQDFCTAPIDVVPNPIPNVISFDKNKNIRKVKSNNPVVAMIINGWGRLKNAKPAMEAFSRLKIRIPGAELRMFGTGFGVNEEAEVWAKGRGINRGMAFFGRTPHHLLMSNLREVDVLLHPSLLESCPMGVVEAMACGLPVIGGAASGGLPWVVGDGGILTDVSSPQALADAMYQLLTDAEIHNRAAQAASARAGKIFTAASVAEAYESQYRRAIEWKSNGR